MPVPREVVSASLAKWYRGQKAAESDDKATMLRWWRDEGTNRCSFCDHFNKCHLCPLRQEGFACHPAWDLLSDLCYGMIGSFEKGVFANCVDDMIDAIEDVEISE